MEASIRVIVRVRPSSSPSHALLLNGSTTPFDNGNEDATAETALTSVEGRWVLSSNSIYFQPPSAAANSIATSGFSGAGVTAQPPSPAGSAYSTGQGSVLPSEKAPPPSSMFAFDRVFGPRTHTAEIYHASAQDIVNASLEGVNGTIFAYGQTSSGKTYTMQGSPDDPGIISMAIKEIFSRISTSEKAYSVKASYLEIYNE
ncbi:NADH-ubiquinone oxidoreductase chain 1, partial [Cladochytrium tenue]